MVKVKICGITEESEIDILNVEKPNYAGFVFAKSKRNVALDKARILIDKLDPSIKSVGVFRFNSIEYVKEVASKIKLDVIQLHGDEDNDFIEELKGCVKSEIWKAFLIKSEDDIKKVIKCPIDTVLLDGSDPGSGKVFDWEYLKGKSINKKIFIAGGINESNVNLAVNNLSVYGVDVSSGVESTLDGITKKDSKKIHILISKVRENNEGKI